MSYGPVSKRYAFFDGTSARSATFTSNPFLVADYRQLSMSIITSDAQSSLHTVQASNEDGLRASITTWSTVTTITAQGIYAIEPGMRWLRVLRSSLDSLGEVFLQART